MFPAKYFGTRYFPNSYFPEIGAGITLAGFAAAIGNLKWLVKHLPQRRRA